MADPIGNTDLYNNVFKPGGRPTPNLYDELLKQYLPSTNPNRAVPANPANQNVSATTPTASTGRQSSLERMLGRINTEGVADVASTIGSYSDGKRTNRLIEGNYTQDYDQMMVNRESDLNKLMLQAQSDRNANESDALRKLQQTAYIKGNTSDFNPGSISVGGKSYTLPTFGFGPKASSAEELAGASTLQDTIMSRFGENGSYQPAQSYQPHPLDTYAKPGTAENVSSNVAAGGGVLGGLMKMLGGLGGGGGSVAGIPGATANTTGALSGNYIPGALGQAGGKIGSIMGKAAPIAGAITGGVGLMKDRGLGGNIANGVTAGASIGSMVPGLGTAIGAGIGAGVGALRGIGGGPGEAEVAGRQVAAQGRQAITSGATPQQLAEAKGSGWAKPDDALALIVVRDALAKAGKNPAAANAYMDQLFKAEKGGPQAVEAALINIMGALGQRTGGGPNISSGAPGQYRG